MSAGLSGLLGSWQDMKRKQEVSIHEPLLCHWKLSGIWECQVCREWPGHGATGVWYLGQWDPLLLLDPNFRTQTSVSWLPPPVTAAAFPGVTHPLRVSDAPPSSCPIHQRRQCPWATKCRLCSQAELGSNPDFGSSWWMTCSSLLTLSGPLYFILFFSKTGMIRVAISQGGSNKRRYTKQGLVQSLPHNHSKINAS